MTIQKSHTGNAIKGQTGFQYTIDVTNSGAAPTVGLVTVTDTLPAGVTWGQIYGVGWLTGIGFTMSLFITELAFDDPVLLNQAKVGILVASLVAGVGGYLVLRRLLPVAEDVVSWRALPQKQPAGD